MRFNICDYLREPAPPPTVDESVADPAVVVSYATQWHYPSRYATSDLDGRRGSSSSSAARSTLLSRRGGSITTEQNVQKEDSVPALGFTTMAADNKVVVSPLHRVIDAGRWDAEPLCGRLIVLIHAAFLDAGFVPLPHPTECSNGGPIPREIGMIASTLSLWYTVPQLLHRQDKDAAINLRLRVFGRRLLLSVARDSGWFVDWFWALVDALGAAPVLLGDLDATARALRRDAGLAALWRGLSDNLCRRALADLCQSYDVELEPTFLWLPDDVKAAVLALVVDGADLAIVERTCTAMRRLVAERDRELWKPLYEALTSIGSNAPTDSMEMSSWKERYVRERRRLRLRTHRRREWYRWKHR